MLAWQELDGRQYSSQMPGAGSRSARASANAITAAQALEMGAGPDLQDRKPLVDHPQVLAHRGPLLVCATGTGAVAQLTWRLQGACAPHARRCAHRGCTHARRACCITHRWCWPAARRRTSPAPPPAGCAAALVRGWQSLWSGISSCLAPAEQLMEWWVPAARGLASWGLGWMGWPACRHTGWQKLWGEGMQLHLHPHLVALGLDRTRRPGR